MELNQLRIKVIDQILLLSFQNDCFVPSRTFHTHLNQRKTIWYQHICPQKKRRTKNHHPAEWRSSLGCNSHTISLCIPWWLCLFPLNPYFNWSYTNHVSWLVIFSMFFSKICLINALNNTLSCFWMHRRIKARIMTCEKWTGSNERKFTECWKCFHRWEKTQWKLKINHQWT